MNQFATLAVSNPAFAVEPDFELTGSACFARGLMLVLVSGAEVAYSFDGVAVHGRLVASTPAAAKTFDRRVFNKIWFRAASAVSVDVETWVQSI